MKAVGVLLRGMHHIKAAAWEPAFLRQARCLFSTACTAARRPAVSP